MDNAAALAKIERLAAASELLSARAALDPRILQAYRVAQSTYSLDLDVITKAKNLVKFGRTENADVGVKTTVATFQGAVINETYVTTNVIDALVSDNAADTETIRIEGHTIDLLGNLTFVVQEVILTGTTPVPLPTPLARCTRLYVKNGTFAAPASDLVGNIFCYDDTDGQTGGTPNTPAATKCMIAAGKNQSEKAATSISSVDAWILTGIRAGIAQGSGTRTALVDVEVRELGGVFRPVGMEIELSETGTNSIHVALDQFRVVPPNSDVRLVATSGADNTKITGAIIGALATATPIAA